MLDGVSTKVTSGSADVVSQVSTHIADSQGGNLTTAQLAAITIQNVSTISQTSISGTASLAAHVSGGGLTSPEVVSMNWANVGRRLSERFRTQAATASLLFGEINTAIDAA